MFEDNHVRLEGCVSDLPCLACTPSGRPVLSFRVEVSHPRHSYLPVRVERDDLELARLKESMRLGQPVRLEGSLVAVAAAGGGRSSRAAWQIVVRADQVVLGAPEARAA